ncbi:hypothetical protein spr_34 [Bacillus phage SPR]|nr:hypothetical protein spr_34 [Bacillus phage SPR]
MKVKLMRYMEVCESYYQKLEPIFIQVLLMIITSENDLFSKRKLII